MKNITLICFVKTPGLSPLKTRLSHGLGSENSQQCYLQMIDIVRELFHLVNSTFAQVSCYWAIAEAEGLESPLWSSHNKMLQAKGSLANRLHLAQYGMNDEFHRFIYIGSDAPALSIEHIRNTLEGLDNNDHVIGPAKDGGFYLFASKVPITQELWNSVNYSTSMTFKNLHDALPGKKMILPELSDVDQVSDLTKTLLDLEASEILSSSQIKFKSYIKELQAILVS